MQTIWVFFALTVLQMPRT